MSKALVRVQGKFRPISGDLQGFRLQACIPNMAGRRMVQTREGIRATKEEVPAFRKPYLIEESGDYSYMGAITEADVERFADKLRWAGYTSFEFIDAGDDYTRQRIAEDFTILSK